jgi:hypothetical protein
MNNFGIVTRFDLTPFPQGEILAGAIANSISDRDAVFKAFSDIAGAEQYDPYASLVTGLSYNSSSRELEYRYYGGLHQAGNKSSSL